MPSFFTPVWLIFYEMTVIFKNRENKNRPFLFVYCFLRFCLDQDLKKIRESKMIRIIKTWY